MTAATKAANLGHLPKIILAIIVIFTVSLLSWYQIPCSSGRLGSQESRQDLNPVGIHTLIVGNMILDSTSGQFVVKNRSHTERLRATYGLGMTFEEGFTECDFRQTDSEDIVDAVCMKVEDKIKLTIAHSVYDLIDCYDIEWTSLACDVIPMDCLHMADAHWFGGSESFFQHWPIETVQMPMQASVTTRFGSIVERYWVNSRGVAVKVNDFIPLHVSTNNDDQMLCLKTAYDSKLYNNPDDTFLRLKYQVCLGNNVRTIHQFMSQRHFNRPTQAPSADLFRNPVWSTWAKYRTDVNQSRVLQLADDVSSNWFPMGHLHIDNGWESVYGDFEFDPVKFPDARGMTDRLHSMGVTTVSVWVTPFASLNSEAFGVGLERDYWLKDGKGRAPAVISCFHSDLCVVLDVTNNEAVDWFVGRLEKLRHEIGIDTFKFGAGEVYYLPESYVVQHGLRTPNEYSTKYVQMAARLGGTVDVQTAHRTQNLPIFVKLYDRFGRWGYDNGLKSIIPATFVAGIVGYPFVAPGIVGGNGAERDWRGKAVLPERELLIRWVQLAAYLPVMTFSICPWEYNAEVFNIAKEMVHVHENLASVMLKAAAQAVETGSPIIRPLWWIAPDDPNALKSDDQFLVGDDLMVAPILDKGARERDVYLPPGKWRDGLRGGYFEGERWLRDYRVKLSEIATFTREEQ